MDNVPFAQVCSMFYLNQRELFSVVTYRCREMVTWQLESLIQAKYVQNIFSLYFQIKEGQGSSVLVMVTEASSSQPHISASHTLCTVTFSLNSSEP